MTFEVVAENAAGSTRPRGAVTIGDDAAGAVVVVVVVVDGNDTVVVDEPVVDVVDDGGAVCGCADELQAVAPTTSSAHATHRPSPRRTPS